MEDGEVAMLKKKDSGAKRGQTITQKIIKGIKSKVATSSSQNYNKKDNNEP